MRRVGHHPRMNIGRVVARVTIGGLLVGHGTQKLFGWFGGPGVEGTTGMMDKLETRPPRAQRPGGRRPDRPDLTTLRRSRALLALPGFATDA